jgi:hypothetical protein
VTLVVSFVPVAIVIPLLFAPLGARG